MSSLTPVVPAVVRSMIYLGMDVHKDSITFAVLPEGAKAPTRLERLPNDLPKLKKWLDRVAREGEVHACYEASGAGYVLHRALRDNASEASYHSSLVRFSACWAAGHRSGRDGPEMTLPLASRRRRRESSGISLSR